MQSKIKLLKVLDILSSTDEKHPITASKICALLEGEGVSAERKSVCRDINTLIQHGYKIVLCRDNKLGYYMEGKREKKAVVPPVSTVSVTLAYDEENEKAVVDLLGKAENREAAGEVRATFRVDDGQLFTKLLLLGTVARIVAPENVRAEFVSRLETTLAYYNKPRGDKKIEVWLL